MNENIDYKKMYHIMVNAAEEAMNILIAAQQQCEELYLSSCEKEATACENKQKEKEAG